MPGNRKPTLMKTGKMKQLTYIFAFTILAMATANAQIGAGAMASSILTTPVILADINLKVSFANNTVNISWQATQQMKVRRYELEKSIDGENFIYVTAFAGSEKQYNTADNNLFAGTSYYRLKIVGEKNNSLYSSIELIDTKANANEIRILPTQLDDKLFVWVPSNTSISCASISGADGKMQRKAIVNNSNNIAAVEIKGLPAGVYSLGLKTNKGETVKLKFSKSL